MAYFDKKQKQYYTLREVITDKGPDMLNNKIFSISINDNCAEFTDIFTNGILYKSSKVLNISGISSDWMDYLTEEGVIRVKNIMKLIPTKDHQFKSPNNIVDEDSANAIELFDLKSFRDHNINTVIMEALRKNITTVKELRDFYIDFYFKMSPVHLDGVKKILRIVGYEIDDSAGYPELNYTGFGGILLVNVKSLIGKIEYDQFIVKEYGWKYKDFLFMEPVSEEEFIRFCMINGLPIIPKKGDGRNQVYTVFESFDDNTFWSYRIKEYYKY